VNIVCVCRELLREALGYVVGDITLPGEDVEAAGLDANPARARAERDLNNVVKSF